MYMHKYKYMNYKQTLQDMQNMPHNMHLLAQIAIATQGRRLGAETSSGLARLGSLWLKNKAFVLVALRQPKQQQQQQLLWGPGL